MSRVVEYRSESKEAKEDIVAIVAHGGGGTIFRESHSLCKYMFSKGASSVFSVELPCHGKDAEKNRQVDALDFVDFLQAELEPKVSGKTVLVGGFSLGGLFLMKLYCRLLPKISPKSVALFFGCAFRAQTHWQQISYFWDPKSFIKSGKASQMEMMHGKNWAIAATQTKIWMSPGSPLWVTEEERNLLKSLDSNVFFIVGATMEPMPEDDIIFAMTPKEIACKIYLVPSDHWSYFTSKWSQVEPVLNCVLGVLATKRQGSSAKL